MMHANNNYMNYVVEKEGPSCRPNHIHELLNVEMEKRLIWKDDSCEAGKYR